MTVEIPVGYLAAVASTLVAAIGALVVWIRMLYAELGAQYEKRIALAEKVIEAQRDSEEALKMIAAEMRELRR